jgi:hypothetical protein
MARADLLLDLVEAERRGDRDRFRVLVEAVIAEERANQHHLLADRLSELITTTGQGLVRDDRALTQSTTQVMDHSLLNPLLVAPFC